MARDEPRRVGPTRDPGASAPDEDLPESPPSERLVRWRRPLGTLGLIAVLVLGGWRLATIGDDDPSPSPPPTSPAPVVGDGAPIPRAASSALDSTVKPISPCAELGGDGLSCVLLTRVPDRVRTALRTVFPRVRVDASYSVAGRDHRLYLRRISLVAPKLQVDLVLSAEGPFPARAYSVLTEPEQTVTQYATEVRADGRRYRLTLEVRDHRGGNGVARAALDRLARDPRLRAVP